ncbi:hypothetical protein BDZ45DRAFT_6781 [Acephala macrosclerotiorum]|nr:hypothetical protein BDZ45DRAFT_6781 [Acephala macrosclerotiorum]
MQINYEIPEYLKGVAGFVERDDDLQKEERKKRAFYRVSESSSTHKTGIRSIATSNWWQCCSCQHEVNGDWHVLSCSDCSHIKCDYCACLQIWE